MSSGVTTKSTWWQALLESFKTRTATWLVTFMLGVLGLFSGYITESIRFSLNRADLRTKQYDELATEISQYIFFAELSTEFIESSSTTKTTLTSVVEDYNTHILSMRKNEFVYIAWIHKYWGRNQRKKFETFMDSVRQFDKAIHSINDELGKIQNGKTETIGRNRADEAMVLMKPAVKNLRKSGYSFLTSLN